MDTIRAVALHAPVAALTKLRRISSETSVAGPIEVRTVRLEPGRYAFPTGRGLTDAERGAIDALEDELSDRLADRVDEVDDVDVIREVANQVDASFKAREGQASAWTVFRGFVLALAGRSVPALREALRRLLNDEAPAEYSRTFAPTPADLAKLTGEVEAEWKLERDRLLRLRSLPELEARPLERQPSEAEMADVRERAARLTGRAASARRFPAAGAADRLTPADRAALEADLARWDREARERERLNAARRAAGDE